LIYSSLLLEFSVGYLYYIQIPGAVPIAVDDAAHETKASEAIIKVRSVFLILPTIPLY